MPAKSVVVAVVALALALIGCGGQSQDEPSPVSASPAPEVPGWIVKKIDPLTTTLGDANAEVWWAPAKAEQLSGLLETDDEPRGKSVYLVAMHGDFDNIVALGLPGSNSDYPDHTWVWAVYSADFKEVTYAAGREPYRPPGVRLLRVDR